MVLGSSGEDVAGHASPSVIHLGQQRADLVDVGSGQRGEVVRRVGAGFAAGCVTPRHAHHYRGFARTQWQLFGRTNELNPLLYTFRALPTGIHLMRTGAIEADLSVLVSELHGPSFLPELILAKAAGEHPTLSGGPSPELLWQTYERWLTELVTAQEKSTLPEHPSAEPDLHRFVVSLRLTA